MTSQKNICLQNKLEFFFEKICYTVAVLGMLKQNFSFLASYVIVIWMLQKKPLK